MLRDSFPSYSYKKVNLPVKLLLKIKHLISIFLQCSISHANSNKGFKALYFAFIPNRIIHTLRCISNFSVQLHINCTAESYRINKTYTFRGGFKYKRIFPAECPTIFYTTTRQEDQAFLSGHFMRLLWDLLQFMEYKRILLDLTNPIPNLSCHLNIQILLVLVKLNLTKLKAYTAFA